MERERPDTPAGDVEEQVTEDTEQPTAPDPSEEEGEEKEEERQDPVMQVWGENEQKPSDQRIEEWKNRHGDIYMIALDELEHFVFRPLSRHEYKQLLTAVQNEQLFMEQVVQKCTLWPTITPEWLTAGKGGTVPTLHGVIMESSNFLAPEIAMTLVRKL